MPAPSGLIVDAITGDVLPPDYRVTQVGIEFWGQKPAVQNLDYRATQIGAEVWASAIASSGGDYRVTQVGIEFWGQKPAVQNLDYRVTQIGAEVWADVNPVPTAYRVTQIGIEAWISVTNLPFAQPNLWRSDVMPSLTSTYDEGGPMTWIYQTVLLPDNQEMANNAVVETNLTMAFLGETPTVSITAADTDEQLLGAVTIAAPGTDVFWNEFDWNEAVWNGTGSNLSPYQVAWASTLVFKQMQFTATGESAFGFKIGNLYARYQVLGYVQQTPSGVR